MDDDDFFTDPVHSSSIANIHNDEWIQDIPKSRKCSPQLYRIKSNAGSVPRVAYRIPAVTAGSGNTASIALITVLTAVALGFLALCLHIWFNILPLKG